MRVRVNECGTDDFVFRVNDCFALKIAFDFFRISDPDDFSLINRRRAVFDNADLRHRRAALRFAVRGAGHELRRVFDNQINFHNYRNSELFSILEHLISPQIFGFDRFA